MGIAFCSLGCPASGFRMALKDRPLNSEFEWRNETAETIWVDTASGLEFDPMPGILTGGSPGDSGAYLTLPPQPFPQETTITWWLGERTDKETATIQRFTVKIPPRPNPGERMTLAFTFKPGNIWEADWERPRF